ncbi:MAG: dihydrodipicolinate synthase family protein [Deltaproteobacteria bacterium]|nr:dihydrodipicolinate synthase family protein [Deltaproteobacteria bacterium]
MEGLSSPRGLIIDLITPLKNSGDIDGHGLGKHLDRVLPHVQALLLASPYMGEGKNLDSTQRDELLEKVLVVVRGRIPILVWISQDTEEKTRETLLLLKKRLELRKYTGPLFWLDTPLYYHSNRGLPLHYRNMFSMVNEPFLLHNDPYLIRQMARPLKRNNIRTSIFKELARTERIRGLVFLGPLDRARNYQKALASRTDFRIYDGEESHFLRHPSLSGVISMGANLAPGAWEKITASSLNLSRSKKEYQDHLHQIWKLGEYLHNLKDIYQDISVPIIKQVLSDMGSIDSPACTFKAEDMGEKTKLLKDLMKRHGDYPSL